MQLRQQQAMQQRRTPPPLQQQMGLPQLGLPGSPMYGGGGGSQQQFGGGFAGALGSGMLQQAPQQQQQPSGANLAHLFQVIHRCRFACDNLLAQPPACRSQCQVQ